MSARAKHTPGPWNVVVGLNDENAVCSVWPVPSWKPLQVKALCRVHSDAAESNARLIAESPALYEALDRIVAASDRFVAETGMKHGDLITDAVEAARPVLARARGES